MGRSDRVFNPHVRASLAEALECLLPPNNRQSSSSSLFSGGNNQRRLAYDALVRHPCASYTTESLLNVFVSIEMSGQSVQFEQKFNYRRPMYELIEYLWNVADSDEDNLDRPTDVSLLRQHRIKLKVFSCFLVLFVNFS